MTDKKCADCVWVHAFKPRQDEIERGLTLGCRRPDYEGYTHKDNPACGGVFFEARPKVEVSIEA